jgi:hypothetical protein
VVVVGVFFDDFGVKPRDELITNDFFFFLRTVIGVLDKSGDVKPTLLTVRLFLVTSS